jgi:hypothetical protein
MGELKIENCYLMTRSIYFFTFLLLPSLFHFTCMDQNIKTYAVKRTDRPLQLTGRGTDAAWRDATEVTGFTYPWRDDQPPATRFKALWDDEHFYFLYRAADTEIIAKTANGGERDVVNSDRVEIFFKSDDRMDPYYALEMDALGRVLDTEGRFYRNIDYQWQWPAGHLILKASTDSEGYWVEGSISLASLRTLGLLQGRELKAGLYRGEYLTNADGETEVRWISWVTPDSEKPDFHIPSSFGLLTLVD